MSRVRDHFGLGGKEIHQMLEDQNFCCKICGKELDGDVNVDHCHLYNEVRDILCTGCNLGLGHFKDNPEVLRNAANYVERWNEAHKEHLEFLQDDDI